MATSNAFPSDAFYNTNLVLGHLVGPQNLSDQLALYLVVVLAGAYLLRHYTWDKPDPFLHLYYERPQKGISADNTKSNVHLDIAERLHEDARDAIVLWGSQSGVAEGFAARLAKDVHARLGLNVLTADLSDCEPKTIAGLSEKHLVFFVMSTYGEGDPSDDAQGFWEWLHEGSADKLVCKFRYAAFGLGNRNYKHYNRVIDVVTSAVDAMGASAIMPVGKADDACGETENDFATWKDTLVRTLSSTLGIAEKRVVYEPTLEVLPDSSLDVVDLFDGTPQHKSRPESLPVVAMQELLNDHTRYCLHVELNIAGSEDMKYKTGDHLGVWPVNPEDEATTIIRALDLEHKQHEPLIIRAIDKSAKLMVPSPTTFGTLVRNYLEICAAPLRDVILGLVQFAPSASAKDALVRIARDNITYTSFASKTQLTFGRVLHLCAPGLVWSEIPLSYVVESIPMLQPRYYSISSSSVVSPRRIAITVGVTRNPLRENQDEVIAGVASNYLLFAGERTGRLPAISCPPVPRYSLPSKIDGDETSMTLTAHVRRSKFKLPLNAAAPLIMVAAGTGLAPFRAFISERAKLKAMGRAVGDMLLFFGCRNADEDYIYRSELEKYESELGGRLRIITAFSRPAAVDTGKKCYVQDRLALESAQVCDMITTGMAYLYICGRTLMARDVRTRCAEVLSRTQGWTTQDGDEYISSMKRRGRWQEDVWG